MTRWASRGRISKAAASPRPGNAELQARLRERRRGRLRSGLVTTSNYSSMARLAGSIASRNATKPRPMSNCRVAGNWLADMSAPSLINPQPAVMRRGIDRMNIAKASAMDSSVRFDRRDADKPRRRAFVRHDERTDSDYSMGLGLGLLPRGNRAGDLAGIRPARRLSPAEEYRPRYLHRRHARREACRQFGARQHGRPRLPVLIG